MKKLLFIAAIALAAACGDDSPHLAGDSGLPPDGPNPQATFTSYVIDLVTNQTADNTSARAYDEFSTLPDPDQDNATAYSALF